MSDGTSENKMYYITLALAVVLVLMAAALYAGSQSTPGKDTDNTIQMSGYAEKKVAPDTATLNIGVTVQYPTSKEAVAENAIIMSAVIEELKALGLKDEDIRTSYVSVYPVYNYDGKPTIEAYSASNNVEVTTTELDELSDIIDSSASAGANQIGGISFTVSDEMQKELREQLIDEAVADATSKARMLAESLGVDIIGVQTSSLSDGGGQRFYYEVAAEAAFGEAVPTPIQPGESTVSMTVQVTYIIR